MLAISVAAHGRLPVNSLLRTTLMSGLLDRPYREELTVPHRNETCREVGIGVDQGYEGRHLLRMRRGVVDDQQATRAEHPLQVRPPTRILGPFGIEEYEVEGTITRAFQYPARD